MSNILIEKISITYLAADCIVNAANSRLAPGGGVCGAIFSAAGYEKLKAACESIGHCPTGKAVITPGFDLKSNYIIHAVGPIWQGGKLGEREALYHAYYNSLKLAKENRCHSIAFPLISSGIYGYPLEEAWEVAIESCSAFIREEADYDMDIIFAVLSDNILLMGKRILDHSRTVNPNMDIDKFAFFWHENEENGCFSQWYPAPFTIEGITYKTCEQYMMAKKALLFEDMKYYFAILSEDDPEICKNYGKMIRNFDSEKWDGCKEEIVYHANYAKFTQNFELKKMLLATGNRILAEASPYDTVWGIGLAKEDADACNPGSWKGENLLGNTLMMIRKQLV